LTIKKAMIIPREALVHFHYLCHGLQNNSCYSLRVCLKKAAENYVRTSVNLEWTMDISEKSAASLGLA
jgi:hypothetical protein